MGNSTSSDKRVSDINAESARPRVIVAEDEALIRLDLVELLEDQGYEVVAQASDGEEAVSLARELEPDLVVMDVKMPKMDGITAADKIAEERICAVVMLTAFSQRDLIERAKEAGGNGLRRQALRRVRRRARDRDRSCSIPGDPCC